MSVTSKLSGDAAENNPQRDAENLARMAERAHKKVEKFDTQIASLGRQQLDAALETGRYLIKAKEILKHGNFEKALELWRISRTITFSLRSGRRYMLLAVYAKEITSANVATLRDAEKYVSALKKAADAQQAQVQHKEGLADGASSASSATAPANSATDLETQVLKTLRRFAEVGDQRVFFITLIEKLSHRLELLPS